MSAKLFILQIAAQNGHQSVVKMLLDRHKRLAYVENDMHLNAFHLAVENGHHHRIVIMQ
jgi:ankyrin repeat protein